MYTFERNDGDYIYDLTFSSDSKPVLARKNGHDIEIWDIDAERVINTYSHIPDDEWGTVYLASAEPLWVCAHSIIGMRLWDLASGRKIFPINRCEIGYSSRDESAMSTDAKVIVQGSKQLNVDKIEIWDVVTGQSIELSSDGRLLAIAAPEEISIWDVTTGQRTQTLAMPGHSRSEFIMRLEVAMTFSPNGRLLALAHNDNFVHIWEVRTAIPQNTSRSTRASMSQTQQLRRRR
ncbi:quinon protein alcohol dehydrogenase-like superfamily [Xylogone sp. PMI_703]|nr:quinon protein alcohol dehydrogenase-like superfamily [Xylogone sp. PMI_703]